MSFDPVSWGFGFAATELTNCLLKAVVAETLHKSLQNEAANWAKDLPSSAITPTEAVFPWTENVPVLSAIPARLALQMCLSRDGLVPSAELWHAAFLEHWKLRKCHLGPDANAFFQIDESEASQHLQNLANRLHTACVTSPELSRRTNHHLLSKILAKQLEEADSRALLENCPPYLRGKTPEAIRLTLQRPRAWEYLLFAEVLADAIEGNSGLELDLKHNIRIGETVALPAAGEFSEWVGTKTREAQLVVESTNALINVALLEALGAPGQPGNALAIVHVAQRFGDAHRHLIEWALQFRNLKADDEYDRAIALSGQLVDNTIREMGQFARDVHAQFDRLRLPEDSQEYPTSIRITLTLTIPDGLPEALEEELNRLTLKIESGELC